MAKDGYGVTLFDINEGKRESLGAVVMRFKRLDWGAWIRWKSCQVQESALILGRELVELKSCGRKVFGNKSWTRGTCSARAITREGWQSYCSPSPQTCHISFLEVQHSSISHHVMKFTFIAKFMSIIDTIWFWSLCPHHNECDLVEKEWHCTLESICSPLPILFQQI